MRLNSACSFVRPSILPPRLFGVTFHLGDEFALLRYGLI